MRKLVFALLIPALAFAQTPDAFTGTWKLNVEKSDFKEPSQAYLGGVRIYEPTRNGTHVAWKMLDANRNESAGQYTVKCKGSSCLSKNVQWTITDTRSIKGQTSQKSGPLEYTRSVNEDGSIMTIRFFKPNSSTVTSVQIWEKQPIPIKNPMVVTLK